MTLCAVARCRRSAVSSCLAPGLSCLSCPSSDRCARLGTAATPRQRRAIELKNARRDTPSAARKIGSRCEVMGGGSADEAEFVAVDEHPDQVDEAEPVPL